MLKKYFLRVHPSRLELMYALGVRLGALMPLDNLGYAASLGGTFVHVGHVTDKKKPLGLTEDNEPYYDVVRDENGVAYEHFNLLTPIDLLEAAQTLAQTDALVAAGLSSLQDFFVLDENGKARPPANPQCDFA